MVVLGVHSPWTPHLDGGVVGPNDNNHPQDDIDGSYQRSFYIFSVRNISCKMANK